MKKRNRTACLMLFAGFVLCGFLGAQDGFLSPTVAAPAAAESIQLEQIQIQSGTFTAVRAAHGSTAHAAGIVLTLPKAQLERLKHELQVTSERSESQW